MLVSVIIPTIDGREPLEELTLASLRATTSPAEVQVVIVRNQPCIGTAWNAGARAADGEFLMLAADDVLFAPGTIDAGIEAADGGVYPAPFIINHDGTPFATGSMGGGWILTDCADRAPVCSSQFPFLSADAWSAIGPALDLHYFADDYLAARARAAGLRVEFREDYSLIHNEGTLGREEMVRRSMTDRLEFEEAMRSHEWGDVRRVA